jgi:pseudaminic acid cytidylyltransferase
MSSCNTLAVVPARGGSKRIPKKNIRDFCGRPLIGWPLTVLSQSELVDEVIVSTDSPEIAEISRQFGASVPFLRPSELSDDYTGTATVAKHAAQWYLANVGTIDHLLLVYPAAVFMTDQDIKDAFSLLRGSDAQTVFTGTAYPYPIQRALRLDADSRVSMLDPRQGMARSQDLEETYHDAGQFYLSRVAAVIDEVAVLSPSSRMLVLPRHRVVDIDTPADFELAERLFLVDRARSEGHKPVVERRRHSAPPA